MKDSSPTDPKLLYRRIAPHSADCYAIKNAKTRFCGTPWAYLKEIQYRDRIGRLTKRGGTRWWLIGCNCIGCKAAITVNETSILEALPHA